MCHLGARVLHVATRELLALALILSYFTSPLQIAIRMTTELSHMCDADVDVLDSWSSQDPQESVQDDIIYSVADAVGDLLDIDLETFEHVSFPQSSSFCVAESYGSG